MTPEDMLKNLLARIHRDGGHYTEKHGLERSAHDADLIVAELYVPKCVLGEPCKEHGFIHGAEAEELRQKLEEYALDVTQGKKKVLGETVCEEIHTLLQEVDARDSVAFLERQMDRTTPVSEEEMDDG